MRALVAQKISDLTVTERPHFQCVEVFENLNGKIFGHRKLLGTLDNPLLKVHASLIQLFNRFSPIIFKECPHLHHHKSLAQILTIRMYVKRFIQTFSFKYKQSSSAILYEWFSVNLACQYFQDNPCHKFNVGCIKCLKISNFCNWSPKRDPKSLFD